jgi:Ca2+-binding EF-hand superfamily protein
MSSDPARQMFDAVDKDRSGRIGLNELGQALSSAGFRFRQDLLEDLIKMYDQDKQGNLAFMDFKNLHEFISKCQQGFQARDMDRSGRLEGAEVRAALAQSGYQVTEPVFQLMMKKYDKNREGGLKFDDYMELSIMIGKIRNTFSYYDTSRTGNVTFNFDAFAASIWSIL